MTIVEAALKYRVVTLVLTTMLLFGGISAFNKLGRLEDPEFTIKDAKIYTSYPGATAKEVSEEVTDVLETAVQKLGQLDYVESVSEPGLSTITITIKDKYDKFSLPQVWDEVRRKVNDAQGKLPPGAGPSIVYDDFGDVYGVFYAVYGDGFSYAELKEYAKMLRRELLLCDDVGDVTLFGEQPEVVYLEISRAKMAQLGLSPNSMLAALEGQSLVAKAGKINIDDFFVRIQPSGELTSVESIGELLLLNEKGSKIYLKDIADITRGYQDPPAKMMRYNGHEAIGLGISTVEGGNVVTMGNSLDARLRELQEDTPIGMEIGIVSHQTISVNTAISGFMISLIEAVVIVIGVLILAMGLRSSILIGGVLILTICATFMLMQIKGVMLERISLGALIIALGMLVDNAIVVVEGIIVNMQRGDKPEKAAVKIVNQTMWPLLGATIVAILAFAAIGASQDSTGEYCRSLYSVIMFSLFLSWVLAITTTPLLGVMFLKPGKQEEGADPYAGKMFQAYKKLLEFAIRRRWGTIILMVVMLFLAGAGFKKVRKSFFPDSTRPQFMVHFWLPQGTHIEKTRACVEQIEEQMLKKEGVTGLSSFVGGGSLRFLLTYTPEEDNDAYALFLVDVEDYKKVPELIADLEKQIAPQFPDAMFYGRRFVLGPGDPNKIQVRISGPDFDVLRGLSDQVKEIMLDEPTTKDVWIDWRNRVPLMQPVVAEAQAHYTGITRRDIAHAMQRSLVGIEVGVYREKDELLPIILRAPEMERTNVVDIASIQVYNPIAGRTVPISQVVSSFETVSENTLVRRRNRKPTIWIKGDPAVGEASQVLAKLQPRIIEQVKLPPGYALEWAGEYEDSSDAQAALASNLPVIGILIVLIVITLFNSLRKPLIIFLTVPLAAIGVTLGLLVMNQPFGFMALLGFMSLAGMLIKNAIVLVDEIGLQTAEGKDPYDAVVGSGLSRCRPVAMAAATTVLGMIPLVPDAFFVSMAVTIMFGLTFATILTLIVVPTLYTMVFRIKIPK
jgi:multidrug efflux pump subunit AcrB